jgi:hypothetical protein
VLTLLHASVVARAIELANGRRARALRFDELDAAARSSDGDGASLADEEPELASYLQGNVSADDPTLGGKRYATAMRVLAVIARAFVDQQR